MQPPAADSLRGCPADADLDRAVEAFEAAQQGYGYADPARFAPGPRHPLHLTILRELVCVDLDYGWGRGQPTPLEDYRRRFPALFQDPAGLRAVVWEEYRQRRQAGEEPDAEEYRRRFGVSPLDEADEAQTRVVAAAPPPAAAGEDDGPRTEFHVIAPAAADDEEGPPTAVFHRVAPAAADGHAGEEWADRLDKLGTGSKAPAGAADLYRQARQTHPAAAERYAEALAALPEVGDTFVGEDGGRFYLEALLGSGAFGRVFLARQRDLANRPVALKVAAELFGERLTLAQLQHTNIVPIYSDHRAGRLQAVCMPYFGGTTLADVFKALKGKSLPTSGKHFVSTLHGRRNSTVKSIRSVPPASSPSPPSRENGAGGELSPEDSGPGTPPVPGGDQETGRQGDKETEPLVSLSPCLPVSWSAPSTAALEALERYGYPEAVLWLGARLADGLGHAHERGVVHRDLKPANILLADDGMPMLLDFNLSDDARLRGSEAGARVGGTLPYMAPEQLRALTSSYAPAVDGRSDLYALGLILFELLTGRPAFAAPGGPDALARLLADRAGPPPRLRALNPAVSPAVEAIVRRCLEPAPAHRYQSARDLAEDIDRHLANLPLRHTPEPSLRERAAKWARRHPRLTSATGVGLMAAGVLLALGTFAWGKFWEAEGHKAEDRLRQLEARAAAVVPRLIRSLDAEQRTVALEQARQAVAAYGVFDHADWQRQRSVTLLPPGEQDRLRARVGELLFLMTQASLDQKADAGRLREALRLNDLTAVCYAAGERPRAWWEQRAALKDRLGEPVEARDLAEQARHVGTQSAPGHYLRAVRLADEGHYGEALAEAKAATAADPRHFWAWLLRGNCHYFLSQNADAIQCYSVCISLDPLQARPYFNRGRVLARTGEDRQALADFGRAVANDPAGTEARVQQALAHARLREVDQAEAELTAVINGGDAPVRCYFQRARVRRLRGDQDGAKADLDAGFAREPANDDELSWVIRGLHWWTEKKDPQKALDDLHRAEQINPRSFLALQNEAHVLSKGLKQPEKALDALNRLLESHPDYPDAIAGRAILLARLGRADDALRDAERIVNAPKPDPLLLYQVAGVYAQTADRPGHLQKSLALIAKALRLGAGYEHLDTDPDLDPIRARPEFRRLHEAAQTLQGY